MAHKNEHGFTMLELLISLAIMAFVIPALAAGVRGLMVLNNRSRDLSLISIVAENKVEELRSSGYNSLNPGTYNFTSDLPSEISNPKTATYTITNPSTGLMQITLTISYWDYNHTRTQTYQTLVSELGVGQ